jgi:hypothetical protein
VLLEIQTVEHARSPYPLADVIAAAPRVDEPRQEGNLIFTAGETRWSADVRVQLRLADPARQEANRRRLLEVLSRPGPLWDPARHPELAGESGSAAWVRQVRSEAEKAFERRTRGGEGE